MKKLAAVALIAPIVLGAAACSSPSRGTVKGTFPYCGYQPVQDGVFVIDENQAPCVVDDTRGAGNRSGYSGNHVVLVPLGTGGPRTPLATPSATATKASPSATPKVSLTKSATPTAAKATSTAKVSLTKR